MDEAEIERIHWAARRAQPRQQEPLDALERRVGEADAAMFVYWTDREQLRRGGHAVTVETMAAVDTAKWLTPILELNNDDLHEAVEAVRQFRGQVQRRAGKEWN